MHQRKRNRAGRFFVQLAISLLALSIIILYIFCLTGSTYSNPSIPQIFLAQIQKSNTLILIGFYGICTDPTSSPQTCTTTINRSANTIAADLFPNQDQTTAANIIKLTNFALDLQQKILLSPLPISGGLFLISLLFTILTRTIARRQRNPGRRLRFLRTLALSLVWLSTSLALVAAALATETVNGVVYVVSTVGDENMNVVAGGLLQVLLWITGGVSVVFSAVVMGVWTDARVGKASEGVRRIDFERGWKEFEDEHIIVF